MLIVSVDECRAGMRLAAPVGHPDQPGHDLLKSGFILTADVIVRLRDKKVNTVFVDYPDLAELDKFIRAFPSCTWILPWPSSIKGPASSRCRPRTTTSPR